MSARLVSCLSSNSRKLILTQRRAAIGQNVARGLSDSQNKENGLQIKRDFCKDVFIPHTCVQNNSGVPLFVKALKVDTAEELPKDTTEYELKHKGYMEVTPGKKGILQHSYAEFLHEMRFVLYKEKGKNGIAELFGNKVLGSNHVIIVPPLNNN